MCREMKPNYSKTSDKSSFLAFYAFLASFIEMCMFSEAFYVTFPGSLR